MHKKSSLRAAIIFMPLVCFAMDHDYNEMICGKAKVQSRKSPLICCKCGAKCHNAAAPDRIRDPENEISYTDKISAYESIEKVIIKHKGRRYEAYAYGWISANCSKQSSSRKVTVPGDIIRYETKTSKTKAKSGGGSSHKWVDSKVNVTTYVFADNKQVGSHYGTATKSDYQRFDDSSSEEMVTKTEQVPIYGPPKTITKTDTLNGYVKEYHVKLIDRVECYCRFCDANYRPQVTVKFLEDLENSDRAKDTCFYCGHADSQHYKGCSVKTCNCERCLCYGCAAESIRGCCVCNLDEKIRFYIVSELCGVSGDYFDPAYEKIKKFKF